MKASQHVVVLGAGFAGVGALQELQKTSLRVTLVDLNDYHTFQPLLYQVATNQLGTEHISSPAGSLIADREGFSFVQGLVSSVDLSARCVNIEGREPLEYDYLLIGLGAVVNFFGTTGANEHALPLYTMEDAIRLRSRIAACLDLARKNIGALDEGVLHFCIIGGGATGVETAGAIAELLQTELERTEPALPSEAVEVHIFEKDRQLLMPFKPTLRHYAKEGLERRGVRVHLDEAVTAIEPTRIHLRSGTGVATHTVVWAGGLQHHPLTASLTSELKHGRPVVEADLSIAGHPEVFMAGDIAAIKEKKTSTVLPQLGSVAQQSGQRAGKNIALLAAGERTGLFEYKDKGTMAIIGRGDAIVQLRSGRTLTGKPAALAWKGVHLMLLAGGEQKASTVLEWGRGYLGRSKRRLRS